MLGQALHNIFDQSFITVIDLLGVPCDYKCVKDATNNKTNITVGYSGRSEAPLVQSLGVESKTITVKVADFKHAPEKFDQFLIKGQNYVAESVQQVHLNGNIIGYRIRTKGK